MMEKNDEFGELEKPETKVLDGAYRTKESLDVILGEVNRVNMGKIYSNPVSGCIYDLLSKKPETYSAYSTTKIPCPHQSDFNQCEVCSSARGSE